MADVELVITISEEMYELCKRGTTGTFLITTGMRSGRTFLTALYKAICNGTPLPKGHGRLIDADALKKEAVMCPTVGNAETLLLDIGDVEHAPTIIEADKEGQP